MLIFLSILIGLITLLVLITVHEFAHFLIAKLSGAYVYEFSIGMGPKIYQWGKKETRYTLRLLPLGGYVSIASEIADPPKGRENEVVEDKQLMENLHRGKKALFISGGSLMNLFLAFILLIIGYCIFPYKQDLELPPTFTNYGPVYDAVKEYNQNHPKNIINDGQKIIFIQRNDLEEFNKKPITDYESLSEWIKAFNKDDGKEKHNITIWFNNDDKSLITFDTSKKENYFLGVTASNYHLSGGQIIGYGFLDSFKNSYSALEGLGSVFTFQWQKLSGPVGIIKSTNAFLNPNLSTRESFSSFFRWASLLSANLFLLNMLPIPPLDGYKFVENAFEAATRKKINSKFKIIVSIAGALLFLLLFITITIKDIFI